MTDHKDSVDTVDFRLILCKSMISHVSHDSHETIDRKFIQFA